MYICTVRGTVASWETEYTQGPLKDSSEHAKLIELPQVDFRWRN